MKGASMGRVALSLGVVSIAACGVAPGRDAMPLTSSASPAPSVVRAPAAVSAPALPSPVTASEPAIVTVGDVVIPRARSELHAGAHRILVYQPDPGPARWGWLWVFDAETKAKLAVAPIAQDDVTGAFPRFAVSRDGARVGWAMGNIGVMEVATGRASYFEKRAAPLAERDWPGAPIFAVDGRHVCIEEHGSLTILPMPTPPIGLQAECFAWKRSEAPETSAYDEDAIVANLPVASGYVALPASKRGDVEVTPTALSADRSLAVLTEVSLRNPGSRSPLRLALLAFDLAHDKMLARIPIPSVEAPPESFSVAIDTSTVGYCSTPTDKHASKTCFSYDLRSGALLRRPPRP